MNPIKIYVSHTISNGGKIPESEWSENCRKVIDWVNELRKEFPEVNFYVPAESEPFVHNAFTGKYLNYNQIIEIDCMIISECDGALFYAPDGFSTGMNLELVYANKYDIETYLYPHFDEIAIASNKKHFSWWLKLLRKTQ